jgi:hypothetical protein
MEMINLFVMQLAAVIDTSETNIPRTTLNQDTLKTIMSIVFGLIGGICLLFIIFGGIKLISSQGTPEGFNKARNTIIYAVVGLIISISAFSIVTFVVGRV